MGVLVPESLDDAVAALGEHPEATVLAGGTDLMVAVNEAHLRLAGTETVVAVSRIPELRTWVHDPIAATVRLGAAVTYAELAAAPLAGLLPALAQAARTVGSPQIRNAATIGGNLATCSPAGDGLPVLSALDAVVEVLGSDGVRRLPVAEFMVGVKRTALAPGELITAVTVPLLDGWQGYAKVGVRNAMVIAIAGACLAVDEPSALGAPRARLGGPDDRAGGRRRGPRRRHRRLGAAHDRRRRRGALRRAGRGGEPPDRRPPGDRRVPPTRRRGAGPAPPAPGVPRGPMAEHYRLHVNGRSHDVADAWLGESLLYVLRERLGLLGAKGACEQGECGSCSVLVDGALVCSCLVLAASAVDVPIITVEGLAEPGDPTDVQRAVRRGRRRAVRLLHARPGDGRPRPARPHPAADGDGDPRGAVGQHLPLHGLRTADRRRAGSRRGASGDAVTVIDRVGAGDPHGSRAHRRLPAAARRDHQGPGQLRLLVRPPDRRGGVGRHAALAAPVRPHHRSSTRRRRWRSRAWPRC